MTLMTSQYRKVAPARIENRAIERHCVILQRATVRRLGKQPIEAALLDLSSYGCRLSVDGSFATGDRLRLRFCGSQPVTATTIWSDDGVLGCRFDEQLDRTLFRALTLLDGSKSR
jgi:PilZ domain